MNKIKKLDKIMSLHGGHWRYNFLDFYYLYNHYFPSKELIQVLKDELPVLMDSYPSAQKVIVELLSRWKEKDYFNQDNLIVANGSSELIKALNSIITKITVPIPTFNEYVQLPPRKLNFLFMKEENKFKLDVNELIKEVKNSLSDFTVINNPNNPVGNITTRDEIEEILKEGIITIVDEAFIDFCQEYSAEELISKYENLIVIKSLTKSAGTAGLRVGYLLTKNQEIKNAVKAYLPIWNVNSLAEKFIELFPNFKEDYKDSIRKTIEDRKYLFEKLKEIPFLQPYQSFANFIFCKTDLSSRKIAETLLDEYNILIKYGLNQKILKSDKYVRFGVKTKKDNDRLISALRAIKK